ncbi:MAG: double-strand break repair protein AddB [Geminicoccaceae bacterium]
MSTIPAGVPFVDALARGLLAEANGDMLALADMLVLLPNRRACRSLRDAFWRCGEGKALALPAIQPIGDIDPDDLLIDPESDIDLPPAIGGLRRRFILTRHFVRAGRSVEQAGRLADDLIDLLDELQTERVSFDALADLVPDHLAAHWQKSLAILKVLVSFWPDMLADECALDPAERRHRVLTALAARLTASEPASRIIAAGSTGSIPATRELLKVIASLPNGEVVLPGLDGELDNASWQALAPQHPQHGLKILLATLGVGRGDVVCWQGARDDNSAPGDRGRIARQMLFRAVMVPGEIEGGFQEAAPFDPSALDGLSLAEHPDASVEALAIALRLRAALLEEGRTAALITPDRALARRVVVELRRFGIDIDDSGGAPLDQTAPGSFLLLAARLVIEGIRPVALLSVLKHPLMRAGLDRESARRLARALDRLCLRGPTILGGFRSILGEVIDLRRRIAEDRPEEREQLSAIQGWLEGIEHAATSFTELARQGEAPLGALLRAHLGFVEALADGNDGVEVLWAKEAGEAAAALCREILEAVDIDDRLPVAAYPALLGQLMASRPVRPKRPGHPRLFVWGQLESRLQQADLTILAGLNEGVWPRREEPGPWLNPAMRESLGLPSLERRIGQAAHDFVQAAAGAQVVLSRAEKDLDGNPTVPSRWLVRLKALLAGQEIEAKEIARKEEGWQRWAVDLDLPSGAVKPEPRPEPRPPLDARPRKLSVSDIGLWMNNPYGLYARRILKLKPLEALEADPDAGDRGTIIHKALERFVRAHPDRLPDDAFEQLCAFGGEAFGRYRQRPQVRAIWWPRFLKAAAWVAATEQSVRDDILAILVEVEGELAIEAPAGLFRMTARADRLERRSGGGIVIVDYKTGAPPPPKDMALGLAPQLPLEGAILQAGGFEGLAGPLDDLQFWQLAGNEKGGRLERCKVELVESALEGLAALIRHYDDPKAPYRAGYRPPTARRGDYDHLARLGEWPN